MQIVNLPEHNEQENDWKDEVGQGFSLSDANTAKEVQSCDNPETIKVRFG